MSLSLIFLYLNLPWQICLDIYTNTQPSVIVVLSLWLGSHRPGKDLMLLSETGGRGLNANLDGIIPL